MRHLVLLGLAAGVGLVGGCSQTDRAEVRQEVKGMRQQMRGAAENARQATADATLAGKVKTALATRKGLDMPKPHIDVDARDGHVVLKGDVGSRAQAELAERTAMETEGVNSVDNKLMLRVPAKGPDAGASTLPGGGS
jgi:osmotically-inducible protein OsmY